MNVWWAGLGLALLGLSASAQEAQRQDEVYSARVSRVFDGDSVWVKPLAGGPYRKLRLEGIDAPEYRQSCTDEGGREVACGRDARRAVRSRPHAGPDRARGLLR